MTTGDAVYWQARAETLETRVQELQKQLRVEQERAVALEQQRERWYSRFMDRNALIVQSERRFQQAWRAGDPNAVELTHQLLANHPETKPMLEFIAAAIAVARLNFDREDSIRPMRNGAQEAYHRLENALIAADLADLPDLPENEYLQRVRAQIAGKRDNDDR